MKLFLGKIVLYAVLLFLVMEVVTRILTLNSEYPWFIINEKNVKTYAPNQTGYYTVGNRRMNLAEYHINKAGFNSYREFNPSKDKVEVALLGDSFIDGLHQNYYNSISRKIEDKLNNGTEVYNYGHTGYDLADELYLMEAYKDQFKLIDYIIIYFKFENDVLRDSYEPDQYWVDSQYFLFSRIQRKSKFISYLKGIGIFEPLRNLKTTILSYIFPTNNPDTSIPQDTELEETQKFLENFKTLTTKYPIDKTKTVFLLDKTKTSQLFLDYFDLHGYRYLDFSTKMYKSKHPTTLIFDHHWNNNGRSIIANIIGDYIRNEEQKVH